MNGWWAASAAALLAYAGFAFVRLGFHQRLPLLFRRWRSINQVLEEAARQHGEQVVIELESALVWQLPAPEASAPGETHAASPDNERLWSAARTLRCVKHLAGVFDSLQVERNERIAIYKDNAFDLYLFGTAALRSGAIAVPLSGHMDARTALAYLSAVGAAVLVTDRAHLQHLSNAGAWPAGLRQVVVVDAPTVRPLQTVPAHGPLLNSLTHLLSKVPPQTPAQSDRLQRGLDDPHFIVHTSGTTGVPKGVLLAGVSLLHSLRAVAVFNLISRRDRVYLALPMNHQIMQLYLQAIFLLGVHTIVNDDFNGPRVLATLAARRISVFFAFPIAYVQLLEAGLEQAALSHMRVWGATADASHEVFQRAAVRQGRFFRDLGIPLRGSLFVDGLGSSEVGIAALMRIVTPWTRRFARRVGRRAPLGPRIKVADAHGRRVPVGQAGRLMIKGQCMLAGYWNAHDQLFAASHDGWWFTGDIVRRELDGELVHLDREADVIAGRHGPIYTLLIEELLHRHPAVMDVCVFGVTDHAGAQTPAAIVATHASHRGYPVPRLIDELNDALPLDTRLAFVQVMDWQSFPIGITGKTLKRQLRNTFSAPAGVTQGTSGLTAATGS